MTSETRHLAVGDVAAIRELASQAEREGFSFVRRFVDQLAAGALRLDAAEEFFLGVFDDGILVAIGGVTRDPYVDHLDTGRLRHVFVRADRRRTGTGHRLVADLEARARVRYTHLRLRTDTTAAAAFYEHLGYHAVINPTATHRRTLRNASAR